MALITLNGVTVLSGTIWMPLSGVWSADLVLDNPDGGGFSDGTGIQLSSDGGSFTLNGTVAPNRNGEALDASHVRVLGGGAGMGKLVTPRYYGQPGALASDVVNAILDDVGETLSSSADAGVLSTNLSAWLVRQSRASAALQLLIDTIAPGANWRVLADGTVWIGSESWPSVTVSNTDAIKFNPVDGSFDLGVEAPFIAPGTSVGGVNTSGTSATAIGNVGRVEHHIEGGKIRTIVYQDLPQGERGLKSAIGALVENAIAGIDYFALYEAKVISQSPDNTMVDVQPKDARLPGMTGVKLRHGLPGVTVQISPGCFVLVGWDGGDPSKPFACLWGGGETLSLVSIGSGADAVATKQDLADLLTAISNTVIVAMDGGASFKSTLLAALQPPAYAPPWPRCSSAFKVQR